MVTDHWSLFWKPVSGSRSCVCGAVDDGGSLGPLQKVNLNARSGRIRPPNRFTHEKEFTWIGKLDKKANTLMAVWQMKTTRKASAYESIAAFLSDGSSSGILDALRLGFLDVKAPRRRSTKFAYRIDWIICC
jgi:hypothetical protein